MVSLCGRETGNSSSRPWARGIGLPESNPSSAAWQPLDVRQVGPPRCLSVPHLHLLQGVVWGLKRTPFLKTPSSAIPLQGIQPEELGAASQTNTGVHSSAVRGHYEVKTRRASMSGRTATPNAAGPGSGMLIRWNKERRTDRWYHTDKRRKCHAAAQKPVIKDHVVYESNSLTFPEKPQDRTPMGGCQGPEEVRSDF